MQLSLRKLFLFALLAVLASSVAAQRSRVGKAKDPKGPTRPTGIAQNILLQIIRAEDERRFDTSLQSLLAHPDPQVRKHAALAAGRIGSDKAVPQLAEMLLTDRDNDVRQMAAFALGEIESAGGGFALVSVLKDPDKPARARAIEALGKITAAVEANAPPTAGADPNAKIYSDRLDRFKAAILEALRFEDENRRSNPDKLLIQLGLTAVVRTKPDDAGDLIKQFLGYADARIVADALNALARLRLKDGNDDARRLLKHADPIVRANAARVLGATEDKQSFDALLDRALHDSDERVSVSAIRALGSLKDPRAAQPLIERGQYLLKLVKVSRQFSIEPRNELLEIATALGRILPGTENEEAFAWLMETGERYGHEDPETEIAGARVAPSAYLRRLGSGKEGRTNVQRMMLLNWRSASSLAQALGEIPALPDSTKNRAALMDAAEDLLRAMIDYRNSGLTINTLVAVHSEYAIPDVVRAFAKFKSKDLAGVLRGQLKEPDVMIRATAADLLGEQPSDPSNEKALIAALPIALSDKDLNDAALSILDAVGKQKSTHANEAIKSALNSSDYIVRQRAVAALKASGAGDFSDRIGTVRTRNTESDYRRAIGRIGRRTTATVLTTKGPFTIELLPADAALTADNFVLLARKGFFNGQRIPRVVPNFVVQAGDPRGDQNGGPGYQIRCEINEVQYERAAVGMALSGKDTGGSQWFVTHSPQPHLDGGYTVFGRVISGMEVVDRIARGDVIRSVIVNER
jgi:cyclophilin family peptidyl-prolyl cis-trans isomerase/HEAT repeat protein